MNEGALMVGYEVAKKTLKLCGVEFKENRTRQFTLDNSKYSKKFIEASKSSDYRHVYNTALENGDYDIILEDHSFFQFSFSKREGQLAKGMIRFAFYETPKEVPSYDEYLEEIGFSSLECQEEFMEEYEQYLDEQNFKKSVTPIRYDYDYDLHKKLIHSISHIHFGHSNEIRIPTKKVITPQLFTSLVLQNFYYRQWKEKINNCSDFKTMLLSLKGSSFDLDRGVFCEEEEKLIFAT